MERSEPTLFPEWYKGTSSSSTGSSNSNHHSGSSHTAANERGSGFSSRNKFPVSVCDQDGPQSFSERTSSSFRRSVSSNGSMGSEKDLPSWGYSSFGRYHRDRDRDREKDLDIHDRDRILLLGNGFFNSPDSLVNNKSEKDPLRRSQSMLPGRRVDAWHKRPGHDSVNGIVSEGSTISGTVKSSFERDFPSLGTDEKHTGSDLARVSSPGVGSATHNLPITASGVIGSDGWTSALAEIPPIVKGNGPLVLPTLSTSTASTTAMYNSTGLNMAETLAQAPVRVRNTTQLPNDSQKVEELHRQQILKLRPVTPSMPKSSVINSVDKSKTKGARATESSGSKAGQQPLSQQTVHILRAAAKSDTSKTPQTGNFQVLNREKTCSSPTGKDCPTPANDNRVPPSGSGSILPAIVATPKGPNNPKIKVDGRPCGEKKPPSQAQNRIDFFNSLRKKAPPTHFEASPSNTELGQPVAVASAAAAAAAAAEKDSAFEELEMMAPDDEEAAFLHSLGWDENSLEEPLIQEEIESFLSEYKKRRPNSQVKNS